MTNKYKYKPGKYKEKRIINGVTHDVITQKGKIIEDLGPINIDRLTNEYNTIDIEDLDDDSSTIMCLFEDTISRIGEEIDKRSGEIVRLEDLRDSTISQMKELIEQYKETE